MPTEITSSYTDLTPIRSIWKDWTFLNPNANPPSVEFEGMVFPTLTHALNASKTSNITEREELLAKHPFQVSGWGTVRPFADDPYSKEWNEEVKDTTLILTAQRFGLVTIEDQKARLDDSLRYKHAFWLTLTRGRMILYENLHCDTYWGICYCAKHYGKDSKVPAPGENELGKAIMNVRQKLIRDLRARSFLSGTCDWCYEYKNQNIKPAHEYVIYFRSGKLTVRSYCRKHYKAETHDARKWGDGQFFTYPITDLPPEISLEPFQIEHKILRPTRGAWIPPRHYSSASKSSSNPYQMGFHPSHGTTSTRSASYSSCWGDSKDPKDVFGVMIIHSNGKVSNHVTSQV